MPILGGCEATALIREYEFKNELPSCIIIGMSANAEKEKCLTSGMDHFLDKPFFWDGLVKGLQEVDSKSKKHLLTNEICHISCDIIPAVLSSEQTVVDHNCT